MSNRDTGLAILIVLLVSLSGPLIAVYYDRKKVK